MRLDSPWSGSRFSLLSPDWDDWMHSLRMSVRVALMSVTSFIFIEVHPNSSFQMRCCHIYRGLLEHDRSQSWPPELTV